MPTGKGSPLWMKMLRDSPARAEMPHAGRAGAARAPGGFLAEGGGGLPLLPGPQIPLDSDVTFSPAQFNMLLAAIWRQCNLFVLPFLAGLVPIQLRPAEPRRYVFIQNQHATQLLSLGIGQQPGPVVSVPSNGVIIDAAFGWFEPIAVPQDELWILADTANTPGVLVYG